MHWMSMGILTDPCWLVARRSPARRFRGCPSDSVPEERDRTSQPNPSRNHRTRSGPFGWVLQGPKRNRAIPSMSGLEGGARLAAFLVGQSQLRGRKQNSRLPRTFGILPD